tara:strand:+ start:622 stop:1014 length:393 start_codon:yes stop_codon:yes gene_type:complete
MTIQKKFSRIAGPPSGFTLVEGLIALVICSLGLIGALNVFSVVTDSLSKITDKNLAELSAENAILEVWLDERLIRRSKKIFDCNQGSSKFVCERSIYRTPHSNFRKIIILVYDSNEKLLIRRVAFKGVGF